ncbi:MAG TPA: hypothetical protein VFT98_08285 [Myxococcota bacterium]|nr:hypothetical protein [Myxococcota bacterium]
MRSKIGAALVIGALALSPSLALAGDEGHSLEQLVVEMADTPAEHAALATHYRAKAAEARAAAARHESMGRVYTGGKMMQREQMKAHCRKLAEENTAIAAEYEELAKVHEAESKKAQ